MYSVTKRYRWKTVVVKAYVLIEVHTGKTKEVVKAIRKLNVVVSVDIVTGPYDVIAVIRAETLNEVEDLVVSMMQAVAGVSRTITCVAV
jgi:DNA-binding Lrp family transcriptional regulator